MGRRRKAQILATPAKSAPGGVAKPMGSHPTPNSGSASSLAPGQRPIALHPFAAPGTMFWPSFPVATPGLQSAIPGFSSYQTPVFPGGLTLPPAVPRGPVPASLAGVQMAPMMVTGMSPVGSKSSSAAAEAAKQNKRKGACLGTEETGRGRRRKGLLSGLGNPASTPEAPSMQAVPPVGTYFPPGYMVPSAATQESERDRQYRVMAFLRQLNYYVAAQRQGEDDEASGDSDGGGPFGKMWTHEENMALLEERQKAHVLGLDSKNSWKHNLPKLHDFLAETLRTRREEEMSKGLGTEPWRRGPRGIRIQLNKLEKAFLSSVQPSKRGLGKLAIYRDEVAKYYTPRTEDDYFGDGSEDSSEWDEDVIGAEGNGGKKRGRMEGEWDDSKSDGSSEAEDDQYPGGQAPDGDNLTCDPVVRVSLQRFETVRHKKKKRGWGSREAAMLAQEELKLQYVQPPRDWLRFVTVRSVADATGRVTHEVMSSNKKQDSRKSLAAGMIVIFDTMAKYKADAHAPGAGKHRDQQQATNISAGEAVNTLVDAADAAEQGNG